MLLGENNPYFSGDSPSQHVGFNASLLGDIWEGLSSDERALHIKELGIASERRFGDILKSIRTTIESCNPIQILAHFAYYDQLVFDEQNQKGGASPEYQAVEQASVEFLQALVLMIPQKRIAKILNTPPSSDLLVDLNQKLHECREHFLLKQSAKGPLSSVEQLILQTRHHTAFVRNEGFPSQIRRTHDAIFSRVDVSFSRLEGFGLKDVVAFLWSLISLVEKRTTEDLNLRKSILCAGSPDEVIAEFARVIEDDASKIKSELGEASSDLNSVSSAIINYFDLKNFRFFYFNEEELIRLLPEAISDDKKRVIFERLSVKSGELNDKDPESLILNNPVWTKPLIAVGNGSYFMPLPGLVQSFGLEMVEDILKSMRPDLFSLYQKRFRGEFLEDLTESAVRTAFPKGRIYRNLEWIEGATGKVRESDILLLLDTQAIVFECKSGQVRAASQRGGLDSMRNTFKKLIGDASDQGQGFAAFLKSHPTLLNLKDTDKRTHLIDLRMLKDAISVNVHLDYIGPAATMHSALKGVGAIKEECGPSASMPIHDLESVFEVLNRPNLIFHYLKRRAELESSNEINACELDLLGTYLANGFDFGDSEALGGPRLFMAGMRNSLNPYLMGKEVSRPVPRPRRRFTAWWEACLKAFENRNFDGWLSASYALLCVDYESQIKYEATVSELRKGMTGRPKFEDNDTCIMLTGPSTSRTAIATLCVWDEPFDLIRPKIQARIGEICERSKVNRVLILALPAAEFDEPYIGAYYWDQASEAKSSN